jgi:hypothetical protein
VTLRCQMENCRNLIQVSTFKNSQSVPYCDKFIGYMNDAQVSKSVLLKCPDQYSRRFIPPVNNSYCSSPPYAGTKEKCLMCTRLYINTSRLTGKQNTGFCDNCSARYGIHAQGPRDSRSKRCSIV